MSINLWVCGSKFPMSRVNHFYSFIRKNLSFCRGFSLDSWNRKKWQLKISIYRVYWFHMNTFPREIDTLLGEKVPIDCFSQTFCRLNNASFFHCLLLSDTRLSKQKINAWPEKIVSDSLSQVLNLKALIDEH